MIESVRVEYFKKFKKETFPLNERVAIVGPNDSGKSTLLQAIATWNLALGKWVELKGAKLPKSKKARAGISITRKEFTSIPLREMNLLWHVCDTPFPYEETPEGQTGYPRYLKISLKGKVGDHPWKLTFDFRYGGKEIIFAKPSEQDLGYIPFVNENIKIVHVPPFSGIGAEEPEYRSRAYQDYLIGQGKAGDVIRNRILEIYH